MRHLLLRLVQGKSGVVAVAQTVIANIAIQCANVAAGVIVARSLGPGGRGSLSAITMWPQFLAYALTLGVPLACVYYIKKKPELQSSLTGAALLLSLVFGCVATLVGFIVIPYSLHTYPLHTIHSAQIALLVAPLALFGITLSVQVQSADSFKEYNLFRILPPVSILAALLVERLTGTLTIGHAAVAYLLGGTPAMIWNLVWVTRRFRPTYGDSLRASKTLLGYGIRAWGGDLLGMVANQVDRLMIVALLPPEAMGLYVVAQSAAGILNAIPAAVVPVTLPHAAGVSERDIILLAGRTVRMTFFVMAVASLPLLVGGTLLLKLFYGEKYLAASIVLRLLTIETILDGLTAVLSQAFLAAGYPGILTLLQGCGVLSAVPLLFWLTPKWGLNGAALALTLATTTRFIFVLLNFPIRLRVRPPRLLISLPEIKAAYHSLALFTSVEG